MNTYEENLHNTVLASLQNQALDQKSLQSQYNASAFTLYYAEGATITAYEKLETAKTDLGIKTTVKTEAVKDTNICNNLLNSATQASQYTMQSVSNTAVCASNIQIAANAITRLAADVGSIYSIVQAADFHADIDQLSEEVRSCISTTAYSAELASQIAMDASTLTSEVSSANVLNSAKSTSAMMNNILKIVSADYETASKLVSTDNATLATVSNKEKLAEGALECVAVDYNAAAAAYNRINQDLNLNLKAKPITDTTFTVSFDLLKSPFMPEQGKKKSVKPVSLPSAKQIIQPVQQPPTPLLLSIYPVSQYYVIIVKESKQLTFTSSIAESLLLNGVDQCVAVPIPPLTHDGKETKKHRSNYPPRSIDYSIDFLKVPDPDTGSTFVLRDSDGDKLNQGVNYVAFVVAVYKDDYKKRINNFDDFVSAPSQSFCLTYTLAAVENKYIDIIPLLKARKTEEDSKDVTKFTTELHRILKKKDITLTEDAKRTLTDSFDYDYIFTFDVTENPVFKVSYRCMLLPYTDLTQNMLTNASLKAFLKEERELEQITNSYDPRIAAAQAWVTELNYELEEAILDQASDTQELNNDLLEAKNDRDKLIGEKATKIAALREKKNSKPGFFFNLAIAEQVAAGNYLPGTADPEGQAANKKTESQDATKAKKAEPPVGPLPPPIPMPVDFPVVKSYFALIGPATTDNFGNMLMEGTEYIPVVVSVSGADEDNLSKFTNSISDFSSRKIFHYKTL